MPCEKRYEVAYEPLPKRPASVADLHARKSVGGADAPQAVRGLCGTVRATRRGYASDRSGAGSAAAGRAGASATIVAAALDTGGGRMHGSDGSGSLCHVVVATVTDAAGSPRE